VTKLYNELPFWEAGREGDLERHVAVPKDKRSVIVVVLVVVVVVVTNRVRPNKKELTHTNNLCSPLTGC
jgi:hypothetical protein